MGTKQCLHIHTIYCDGNDRPEEMVKTAIEKGFDSIGFSGHSYMEHLAPYSMTPPRFKAYKQEIARLKEAYRDKIEIFCGIELDNYAKVDLSGIEYKIGSVHCMYHEGRLVDFERSADVVKKIIDEEFGGDGLAYAECYFDAVAALPQYGNFDIIGHFDLITKHRDSVRLFDDQDPRYHQAALEAARALQGKIPYFEVNSGAIARGYRKTPYPDAFIIKELGRLGFGAIVSSDCHDRNFLDCNYEQSKQLLRDCGFTEHYIFTKEGFRPEPL